MIADDRILVAFNTITEHFAIFNGGSAVPHCSQVIARAARYRRSDYAHWPHIAVVPWLKTDLLQRRTVCLQTKVHFCCVDEQRIYPEQGMLVFAKTLPRGRADAFASAGTWSGWWKVDWRGARVGAVVEVVVECAIFVPVQTLELVVWRPELILGFVPTG